MKVQIRRGGVKLTAPLRAHIERRLGLVLGRFGDRVGSVVVRFLADGGDKRCQIEVALRPQKMKIERSHADAFAAVNHAAERISISVARALEREREGDWRTDGVRVPKLT
jgi:ribosome-associated translation inhibitor RaiA